MSPLKTYLMVFLICLVIAALRYLIMTGIYYLVVYKLFDRHLHRFKIDPKPPEPGNMDYEMKWALLNKINFGILGTFTFILYEKGWLRIYFNLDEYGSVYAVAILPALLLLLDTYFFWLHYAMHHPFFAPFARHEIHHGSRNVSPWSAFSVHPIEGFFEVLSRPLLLMTVPLHPYTIGAFLIVAFGLNVIGHSGYEFFPKSFAAGFFTRYKSCATYHYMHHQDGRYNLSLFFNFWDRIMGTINPEYEIFYAKVKAAQVAGRSEHPEESRLRHA